MTFPPIPASWYVIASLAVLVGLQTYRVQSAHTETAEVRLELQTLRTQAAEDMSLALAEARSAEARNLQAMKEATKSHESRLAALRRHYAAVGVPAVGLRYEPAPAESGGVPGVPYDPRQPDEGPGYAGLAARCAETTLQLIDLQQFLRRLQSTTQKPPNRP